MDLSYSPTIYIKAGLFEKISTQTADKVALRNYDNPH